MKSSVAVFSTQGNPFPPPAKSRSHYRPSQPQALSEEQKQTVLSPVRLPHHLSDALSPPDLQFLDGSQKFVHGLPESDSSGPFDESWPSSESSNKTPEQERTRTDPDMRMTGTEDGTCDPNKDESVIARYMARFRTGRPTSRLDRSPSEPAMKEFWWLQTSPDSPDAPRFRPGSGILAALGFSPQSLDITPPLAEGSLNDSKLCPEDVDVIGLQERARKLILQSESSLSSGGRVSSEGIGSSPSCVSDVSAIRSSTMDRASVVPVPPIALPTPSVRAHAVLPPEEDVLYQWRLRRKMEQAREGTLPLTTRKRSPSPPVRIPKQVFPMADYSETVVQVPPSLPAASSCVAPHIQIPTSCLCHVPLASPHTASSCVVPHMQTPTSCCGHVPLASPHAASSSVAPHMQTPTSCFSHVPLASPHAASSSVAPHMQTPTSCFGHVPLASPHVAPHSSAGVVPSHLHLQCDVLPCAHSQQPAPPTQAKPVTTGPTTVPAGETAHLSHPSEKHKAVSEKLPYRKPQKRPDRLQENKKVKSKGTESVRTCDKPGPERAPRGPPPPSPVHQAMEQVITERLFSSPQSPKLKPRKRSTAPPTEEKEEMQPVEIAAHLLEEAEDSDGTEFSEDPLLQVLREQRQSLRSRLREVDLRLAELEDENNESQARPQ